MAEERGSAAGLNYSVSVEDGLMSSRLPNPQTFRCGGLDGYGRNQFRNTARHHEQKLQPTLKGSYRPAHSTQARQQGKRVTGGPGMQAVFLDSAANKKSCGTGVFLPQIRPDNQPTPTKKPACSPVLLPSRVVQALNLNVHTLGLHLKSCKEINDLNMTRKVEYQKAREEEPVQEPTRVFSEKECWSPEIFLPKEWTY